MKIWKEILEGERGLALPLALIMLVVGVFLAVPVLALVTTSLNYNRTVEANTLELYSADAGIEQEIWKVADNPGILPAEGQTTAPGYLPGTLIDVNGMSQVETTITNKGERIYQINSIVTNTSEHQTIVDCYVYILNFSNLTDGAITSNGDLTINNCYVDGYVYYDGTLINNNTEITTGDPIQMEQTNWPTAAELADFYYPGDGYDFYPSAIDVKDYYAVGLGPLYRNGSLSVDNTADGNPTLTLNGTIYVTGDLTFQQSGNKTYTLDLNKQTIFVEGNISFPSGSVTLVGSGCIIAIGDIEFMPSMGTGEEDFIMVFSVDGTTNFQPNGDFYGSRFLTQQKCAPRFTCERWCLRLFL